MLAKKKKKNDEKNFRKWICGPTLYQMARQGKAVVVENG